MKTNFHFTPPLTVALFCATGWFFFWMLAFRPESLPPVSTMERPEVIRLVTDDATLRKLKTPTLFALPSSEGFSGKFLENRVDLHLSLEKPISPVRYLPYEKSATPDIDRTLLTSKTSLPQNELPIPGATQQAVVQTVAGVQLFLSPELKSRARASAQLDVTASGLPEIVRINLTVRPDGTVEHALFETPVTNAALLSAVRQLRFKPAAESTESWIDIRFAQEGKK